jgi:hypothetical protein
METLTSYPTMRTASQVSYCVFICEGCRPRPLADTVLRNSGFGITDR